MLFNALNNMKAKQLDGGKFADGQGLWLIKRNKQHGKWILRLSQGGRRREMGLGRWPDVGIAEAREKAATARRQWRDGIDPIEERAKEKYRPKRLTVEDAINGCFEARQAELKGGGLAGRWMSPLSVHVVPKIGASAVEDVDQYVLKSVLGPIWHEKPDVARKAMNRMNLTLQHAAALGLDVDLQAILKVKALLGKQRHIPKSIASLPYKEAPKFYTFLCSKETMSALALRFLMLTCTRTSEVRFASMKEFEMDVWSIPEARTKSSRVHRVPLTPEALKVIGLAQEMHPGNLLFSLDNGKPLSDAAMSKFMKDNNYEARPHGLRSTFRSWAEEQTESEWEVKEMSLGHTVGSKVERAYQRSDLLDKRRVLLTKWAGYLQGSV